jgi:hypothetical protein
MVKIRLPSKCKIGQRKRKQRNKELSINISRYNNNYNRIIKKLNRNFKILKLQTQAKQDDSKTGHPKGRKLMHLSKMQVAE